MTEPWLCRSDASLAAERCPGLIRRRRDEDLVVVKVDRGDAQLLASVGRLDGHDGTVALWLKIALRPESLPSGIRLQVEDKRDAALAGATS